MLYGACGDRGQRGHPMRARVCVVTFRVSELPGYPTNHQDFLVSRYFQFNESKYVYVSKMILEIIIVCLR